MKKQCLVGARRAVLLEMNRILLDFSTCRANTCLPRPHCYDIDSHWFVTVGIGSALGIRHWWGIGAGRHSGTVVCHGGRGKKVLVR